MNKVTVSKAELRAAVEGNLRRHLELFEEAIEGYRRQQLDQLERDIATLRAGKALRGYYLPIPEDHTRDYERILKMLTMHVPEAIEVSQDDFAKYVMDDWEWRRQFLGTSANYSAKAKAAFDGEDETL